MKRYHVLVVEDNLINRTIAVSFLENYGFELAEASSGEEAVKLVHGTRYDMIFMDQVMPGMNGMETEAVIRQECGDNGKTPVIVALTSADVYQMRETFLQCGFQDILEKPLTQDKVDGILRKWFPDMGSQDIARMREEDTGFAQIRIPGIDVEEARKNHPGDVGKYIQILEIYYIDSKRKLAYLQELLAAEDYRTYGIEVHALKSASASIGAMTLSAQAKAQEKAVNEGNYAFIRDEGTGLLACYRELGEAVRDFLDRRQEQAGIQVQGMDRTMLRRELEAALLSLEHFRSRECTNRIEDVLKHKLEASHRNQVQGILEELKVYEDDNAERLLRDMLQDMEKEEVK